MTKAFVARWKNNEHRLLIFDPGSRLEQIFSFNGHGRSRLNRIYNNVNKAQ